MRVWDLRGGESMVLRGHDHWIKSVQLSDDERTVISGSTDKTVRVWDIASGESALFRGHDDQVMNAQLSDDGRTLLSASLDKTVRVWDVKSQAQCSVILFNSPVLSISVHCKLGIFAVGLSDSSVQLWKQLDERGYEWQLMKSSSSSNLSLQLADCEFTNALGLSKENERLLIQRGAFDSVKVQKSSEALHEKGNVTINSEATISRNEESGCPSSMNNNNL